MPSSSSLQGPKMARSIRDRDALCRLHSTLFAPFLIPELGMEAFHSRGRWIPE